MIFQETLGTCVEHYHYAAACETTGKSMLIDLVINAIDRHLLVLQRLQLTIR